MRKTMLTFGTSKRVDPIDESGNEVEGPSDVPGTNEETEEEEEEEED